MRGIGYALSTRGITGRSGAAKGADTFFEEGYQLADAAPIEVYLHKRGGFSNHPSKLHRGLLNGELWKKAESMVVKHCTPSHVQNLRGGPGFALYTRNCFQVLGEDLKTPSKCLICWTPDGAFSYSQVGRDTGGTGMAIKIACQHNIPVYNLQRKWHRENIVKWMTPGEYPQELDGISILNIHRTTEQSECVMRGHSVLGNPFKVGLYVRGEAVLAYEYWLRSELIKKGDIHQEMVRLLKQYQETGSLKLSCCCYPAFCHGVIVRKILLEAKERMKDANKT